MSGSILILTGAIIFLILGVLHLLYTFLDLKDPKRFSPADRELLSAMEKTTIRMRPDAKNFWQSSLGFHFSHSIGVIFYAGVVIAVVIGQPILLENTWVDLALVIVGLSYVAMAHFFWFIIPFIGALLGTALIAAGIALGVS